MNRLAALLALTSLVLAAPNAIGQSAYDWTISASATDPFVHSAPASGALATYYLWLACCDEGRVDGMSAAEFDVVSSGPLHVATLPRNGFLNAGGTTNLLLAVGACPCGPVVAADLLVVSLTGTLGLSPSAAGVKGTVDCTLAPSLHAIDWKGLGVDAAATSKGSVGDCGIVGHCPRLYCNPDGSCYEVWCNYPCELDDCPLGVSNCNECEPTSVEASSWGRTKALYR